MGVFKRLVDKINPQETLNGIGDWIDKQGFSDQERAEFNSKIANALASHVERTQSENTVRSITRRIIALSVIFFYMFLVALAVAAWWFSEQYAIFIVGILGGNMGMAFIAVIGFYFTLYAIDKFRKKS